MKIIDVDSFAGGGGASLGIEMALGKSVDIAINHDPQAIEMHSKNHPWCKHYEQDIWAVDPKKAVNGAKVRLAWFSPDCTHFSKAKGGKPRDNKSRGLAWVVVDWAKAVKPQIIMLENVEEFEHWGPLLDDGQPDPSQRGSDFRRWVAALEAENYRVEWRLLKAHEYGVPTSRKRLYLIARRDGKPIVWPAPTHGPGLLPYRTAAECIDFSLPCPSIFLTKEEAKKYGVKRPLADATMARLAYGTWKYVVTAAKPFIVPVTHGGDGASRVHSIDDPMRTVTGANRGELAVAVPSLIQTSYGERVGQTPRALDIQAPLGTVVAGGVKHSLVMAWLAKHNTGVIGQTLEKPMGTVTSIDHHSLVTAQLGPNAGKVHAFLSKYYGEGVGQDLRFPLHTIRTKDCFALVTAQGWPIEDIGMRMLTPRELFRAQGFPDGYLIGGMTKEDQVSLAGNSVAPQMAEMLVRANLEEECAMAYRYKTVKINGKTKLLHRHLMEQKLGRKLLTTEHVHHKDGNPWNNDIANLDLMDGADHQKHHKQKYPYTKICEYCKKEFTPHPTKRLRAKACTPACGHKLTWAKRKGLLPATSPLVIEQRVLPERYASKVECANCGANDHLGKDCAA